MVFITVSGRRGNCMCTGKEPRENVSETPKTCGLCSWLSLGLQGKEVGGGPPHRALALIFNHFKQKSQQIV